MAHTGCGVRCFSQDKCLLSTHIRIYNLESCGRTFRKLEQTRTVTANWKEAGKVDKVLGVVGNVLSGILCSLLTSAGVGWLYPIRE